PPAAPRPRAGSRSGLEAGAQRLHRRRPDAADLVELVDGGDPAVLLAVVEDVLRGNRPDSLDRVELLERGGTGADRALVGGAAGRRGRAACPLARDDDLLSVSEHRRGGDSLRPPPPD